jgi:CII-binding regulator of phage lambda lysogenization HflD
MTDEEIIKVFDTLSQQQKQMTEEILKITEAQIKFQTQLSKMADAMMTLVGMIGKVVDAQEHTDKRLIDTIDRLTSFIEETRERLGEAGEQGKLLN